MELELGELYPRIGGLSGTLSTNVVKCLLNRSRVSHFRMFPGIQFHILGANLQISSLGCFCVCSSSSS